MTTKALFAAVAAATLLASALPGRATAAEIKIGVLMPLSGKGGAYGSRQETAMKQALDEIVKTGINGNPVQLVVYDTRGENTEAINLTRKLVHADRVLAILGPFFSSECEVAFPIAVQGATPIMTATSAKPGIAAQNRPWAFRLALTSDKLNGPLIDRWQSYHKGTIKKVVILTDQKDAFTKIDGTQVLPGLLKAKGIAVLDNIGFQTGDIDYSAQVTKVKLLNPDGIIVAGLYNEGGNVLREIRKQGLQQPIAAGLGMADPQMIDIAGPAAEGVMTVNSFWPDNPEPRVAAWAAEYMRRAKVQPGNSASLMYDGLHIVKSCIEKSGVTNASTDLARDRERIRDCLANLKDYGGVSGKISINSDGDANLDPTVLIIKNGRQESLK